MMTPEETVAAFNEAGNRATGDTPAAFLEATGLDRDAFIAEVRHYCDNFDVAGTCGDIEFGYYLAKVLEEKHGS